MKDHYNLQRFVEAQTPVYKSVINELEKGDKLGHWMWFIFPQISGLGHSLMSVRFAINSKEEAEEYLKHPILSSRIRECTQIVLNVNGRTANQIFGIIDEHKFRSSITLFNYVQRNERLFELAIDKYFGGIPDNKTLKILSKMQRIDKKGG